jgi:hypothetical protein
MGKKEVRSHFLAMLVKKLNLLMTLSYSLLVRYLAIALSVATKLAIALLYRLGGAIALPNIKLQFDFSTILRQDDGLLGFVP